ncbi:MAG: ATP-binding cassette domain-containing protein [Oscillospiraceae bacterium]|nr:ATP-binding cassette domain-containing protein [Oscillospiraceae bacterium]
MDKNLILEVRELKQHFRINDRLTIKAIDGVTFGIRQGEVFGLVGESGCGKSTFARSVTGIYRPTEGEVFYRGTLVSGKAADAAAVRQRQTELQTVFQDSAASLNPRMTVEEIILEPFRILPNRPDPQTQREKLLQLMKDVGMAQTYLQKRPGELSGGQRQRVAIARALITDPAFVVADEPVASLDISIQAQIISLFQHMQREHGFTFLLIAHDLSVVRFICDRVGVMLHGKLVEMAPTKELFSNPLHPYTQALLSAIHVPDPVYERNKKILEYDTKTPLGSTFEEVSEGHWLLK